MHNPLKPQIICNCHGEPYLIRWRLVWNNWFGLYLHHILRSDEDRELHDHPWSFVTVILRRGYWEETPATGIRWHGTGSILYRPSPWPHRLILPRPAWTLIFVGPRKRKWGFHTAKGWVHWKLFLKAKGCAEVDGQP